VAIGRPALADDARLATQLGRWQHQAEVDAVVGEWTASQDKRSAMTILQAAGVQAGAVLNGRDLLEDPHLAQREFYQPVVHPVGGLQRQRSTPFHLSRTPARVYAPAPRLGQHTTEVLRSLLGYSDAEIAHLEAEGVTGSVPHPRRQQVKA
jgi:crotonobetainyl-CoA:carnitine CoA-transferase CaiB-like acyl-CoA transferase